MRERGEVAAAAVLFAGALAVAAFAMFPKHGILTDPISATKILALVAIGLIALAAPFAFAEGAAERAFREAAATLRASRAWTHEAPYDGPEGRGIRFEADHACILLLEPAGGIGRPRIHTMTPAPTETTHAISVQIE